MCVANVFHVNGDVLTSLHALVAFQDALLSGTEVLEVRENRGILTIHRVSSVYLELEDA